MQNTASFGTSYCVRSSSRPYFLIGLRLTRTSDSFWPFIKGKFGTYADRRAFLNREFQEALNILEFGHTATLQEISTASSDESPIVRQPKNGKIFLVPWERQRVEAGCGTLH